MILGPRTGEAPDGLETDGATAGSDSPNPALVRRAMPVRLAGHLHKQAA